jgi:thiol-disulfide isomerase/thioredoxin
MIRRVQAFAIGIVVLSGFGCTGGESKKPAAEEPVAEAAPAEKLAPDFALPDLEGKIVHLSDSAGKVRLVNFWATWCAPCREEIPTFKELHQTYGDRLAVLAISTEEVGVITPFVKEHEIPYTNLVGNDQVGEDFGGLFGYPTTFLVDGKGRIVDTFQGMVPARILKERVAAAVGAAS